MSRLVIFFAGTLLLHGATSEALATPPPEDSLANFVDGRAVKVTSGEGVVLTRLYGGPANESGAWYTFGVPTNAQDARGPTAVKESWNAFEKFVRVLVPPDSNMWVGIAKPQGLLPGGAVQVWLDSDTQAQLKPIDRSSLPVQRSVSLFESRDQIRTRMNLLVKSSMDPFPRSTISSVGGPACIRMSRASIGNQSMPYLQTATYDASSNVLSVRLRQGSAKFDFGSIGLTRNQVFDLLKYLKAGHKSAAGADIDVSAFCSPFNISDASVARAANGVAAPMSLANQLLDEDTLLTALAVGMSTDRVQLPIDVKRRVEIAHRVGIPQPFESAISAAKTGHEIGLSPLLSMILGGYPSILMQLRRADVLIKEGGIIVELAWRFGGWRDDSGAIGDCPSGAVCTGAVASALGRLGKGELKQIFPQTIAIAEAMAVLATFGDRLQVVGGSAPTGAGRLLSVEYSTTKKAWLALERSIAWAGLAAEHHEFQGEHCVHPFPLDRHAFTYALLSGSSKTSREIESVLSRRVAGERPEARIARSVVLGEFYNRRHHFYSSTSDRRASAASQLYFKTLTGTGKLLDAYGRSMAADLAYLGRIEVEQFIEGGYAFVLTLHHVGYAGLGQVDGATAKLFLPTIRDTWATDGRRGKLEEYLHDVKNHEVTHVMDHYLVAWDDEVVCKAETEARAALRAGALSSNPRLSLSVFSAFQRSQKREYQHAYVVIRELVRDVYGKPVEALGQLSGERLGMVLRDVASRAYALTTAPSGLDERLVPIGGFTAAKKPNCGALTEFALYSEAARSGVRFATADIERFVGLLEKKTGYTARAGYPSPK
jgi:hypothetical protein